MSWFFIAIGAYFLTALNSVIDKYLLRRSIPHPIVYAFYVGLFSIFSVILTPFGFEWPGLFQFGTALSVGVVFLFALVTFFTALKEHEASRVVSIVGGFTPVFILILSGMLLGEALNATELAAFVLLVSGGVVISLHRGAGCGIFHFYKYSCVRSTGTALLSAFLFAIFFVFAKFVFTHQEFISGFVWTRIGSFIAALALIFIPGNRRLIFATTKHVGAKMGGLFIANKALAGVAFLMLNYAIFLGNVTLVNALEGVKYAFLLILVYILTERFPYILREQTSFFVMTQKAVAIVSIFSGMALLALA